MLGRGCRISFSISHISLVIIQCEPSPKRLTLREGPSAAAFGGAAAAFEGVVVEGSTGGVIVAMASISAQRSPVIEVSVMWKRETSYFEGGDGRVVVVIFAV